MSGNTTTIRHNRLFQEALSDFQEASIAVANVTDEHSPEYTLRQENIEAQHELLIAVIDAHTAVQNVIRLREWFPTPGKKT